MLFSVQIDLRVVWPGIWVFVLLALWCLGIRFGIVGLVIIVRVFGRVRLGGLCDWLNLWIVVGGGVKWAMIERGFYVAKPCIFNASWLCGLASPLFYY